MLCLIGLLSLLCQWLAFRARLPAILPLLLMGLLLGPGTGVLNPDALLGDLLFPIVSLAVAVILFEGSLTLDLARLRGQSRMVRNLVLPGMLVTFVIAGVSAHWLLGLEPGIAALLGALVVVTGPTVIAPLLRTLPIPQRLGTLLHWEGILIDPIGALLVVLVYEYLMLGQSAAWQIFALTLATGMATGALAGLAMAWLLKHRVFPRRLETVATLLLMLGAFGISNELMLESGLLTVTVMGIWLANTKGLDLEPIIEFKETLSVLLISALFLLLAARLNRADLAHLDGAAWAWLLVLLLVARPVAVALCALGSDLSLKERWLVGWIAPRGIVAAAISSLFALKLSKEGIEGAEPLVALVFMVIIVTVILQSTLTKPLLHLLGLAAPPRNGYLIFGASEFAVALGQALQKWSVPVLLSDTHWGNLSQARMAGLPVYYGNPVSEHGQETMDLSQIRRVLILSPYRQWNTEVAYHYQDRLGPDRVFALAEAGKPPRPRYQSVQQLQPLFADGVNYGTLQRRLSQGEQIRQTKLSEAYPWSQFQTDNPDALLLIARDEQQRLHTLTAGQSPQPAAGWQLLYLAPPSEANGSDRVGGVDEVDL
ncbi:cation:proton antiporter [Ferrimonas marina]|nr:sodium:proton antiporter [Ferrimonas marina]